MHAKIEVIRGPATGYRVEVSANSPLLIGRAPGIGLCINHDPTISRHHCQIDVTPPNCHLTSLSSNGTFVNGNPVSEIMLLDGDEISIGSDSVFTIHMVEEYSAQLPTVIQKLPVAVADRPTYFEETCASGLTRFVGSSDLPTPWEMTQGLLVHGRVYAIVDFKRMGIAPPATVRRESMLFDWFHDESPPESSPLVLAVTGPEFESILQQGWGCDAMIVLSSQVESTAMLAHLRSALTFNAQGKPQAHPSGLLGICWPGVLQQLLVHRSAEFVEQLLTGINAVLVSDPESPAGWQILAAPTYGAVLKEMGLEKEPHTKAGLKGKKNKK